MLNVKLAFHGYVHLFNIFFLFFFFLIGKSPEFHFWFS